MPTRLTRRARGGMLALLQALALLVTLAAPAVAGSTEGAEHPWPHRPRGRPAAAALPASPRPLHLAEAQLAAPAWLDPRIGMTEGWRDLARLQESRAGSDRLLFSWAGLEPQGPDSFRPEDYFSFDRLRQEQTGGRELVGLIQFTPRWAARDPQQGERSVPRGLGDPQGPWSQFVGRLVRHYRGAIGAWMIWNEMDFRPGDQGAGGSWTWGGSEAEYWQLLKDASRAIKQADPNARVVFGATSYWVDVINGRDLFPERVLKVASRDPEARPNGWFFDAIALNLYRAPDDIYRVSFELKDLLARYGLDKPRWVTELNCMPYDDPRTPKPDDGQRCTLQEQAAFTVQAIAMALAAGWDRALWYQLGDAHVWQEQEAWGLLRDDGSPRPAYQAYLTAARYFSHADRVTFKPLRRASQPWGTPWPDDPRSYYPNWLVYQVVADRGSQRVSALWNSSGTAVRARIPRQGGVARVVDKLGHERDLAAVRGWYVLDLPPASAVGPTDPAGYFYVGGDPFLIVQDDVPPDTAILPPALGNPP